jgi:hypothetical protein
MKLRWSLLFVLSACSASVVDTEHGGTSVGNPNMESARVRIDIRGDAGFQIDEAIYPVEGVDLVGCEHQESGFWPVQTPVALDGTWLENVPPGVWCEQVWMPTDNVVISGTYEGTPFRFELETPHVRMRGAWEAALDEQYLVELGYTGWLVMFRDVLRAGQPIEIGPGHWLHDPLKAAFEQGAGMFWDRDGDGSVSSQERSQAYVARGEQRGAEDPEPDGEGDQ